MASVRREIKTARRLAFGDDPDVRSSWMDGPARILVVDDNPDSCVALGEVLKLVGYHVMIAPTGRRALALTDMHRFDAVVLDLGLPDIDGIDLLRAIRGQAERPLVVVFSGYERRQPEAEEIGCDAFILKPRLEQLLERLETLLAELRAPEPAGAPKVKHRV